MEQRLRDGVVKEVAELESGESRAVDRRTAWGTAPRRQLQHIPADVRGCTGIEVRALGRRRKLANDDVDD
jgi:hypothetical protein